MRKIIYIIFLLFLLFNSCNNKKNVSKEGEVKTVQEIESSITEDEVTKSSIKIDSVITGMVNEEKIAMIYYNQKVDTVSVSFLTHFENDIITSNNDNFKVLQSIGGNLGNEIIESFEYNYKLKKFELTKEISTSRDADEGLLAPSIEVKYFNDFKPNINLSHLKKLLNTCKFDYENNHCKRDYKIESIAEKVKVLGITKSNVSIFNDIAYYIQLCGDNYTASYLLNEISVKYPKRVVTYLNLGDAYWELENERAAKQNYNEYVSQMKAKGKESKIPQRVFDRVQ